MNDTMIVTYDPFAMESRVTVVKGSDNEQMSVVSDIDILAENLVTLAYKYQVYNIKTHAPLAITAEIKRQVSNLENQNYSENKIVVEGI